MSKSEPIEHHDCPERVKLRLMRVRDEEANESTEIRKLSLYAFGYYRTCSMVPRFSESLSRLFQLAVYGQLVKCAWSVACDSRNISNYDFSN